ncbi:MAG: hypothetical protein JXM79_25390 [Sedimentisphaerales bacterium]|nr:hypothetical protein [Sedimentisphaerales bacterium]
MNPAQQSHNLPINKVLTNLGHPVSAFCSADFVQEYPDLIQVVKDWPDLPERIRTVQGGNYV